LQLERLWLEDAPAEVMSRRALLYLIEVSLQRWLRSHGTARSETDRLKGQEIDIV